MLRKDGVLSPMVIAVGLLAGATTVLLEALLFRGLLDAATYLGLVNQRLAAAADQAWLVVSGLPLQLK